MGKQRPKLIIKEIERSLLGLRLDTSSMTCAHVLQTMMPNNMRMLHCLFAGW